jgi:hypothetical protein
MRTIDNDALEKILSLPFKSKNTYLLSLKDFIYTLSFDLRFFSPEICENLLDRGLRNDLISIKENIVRPSTSVLNIKTEVDYLKLKKKREI